MNRAVRYLCQRNSAFGNPLTRNFSSTSANKSGQWLYRESGEKYIPKKHIYLAEAVGAVTWYWILIHLWHEPEHVLGDFPYPDPSKWTNQELGISD